jgi:hypothetical protein
MRQLTPKEREKIVFKSRKPSVSRLERYKDLVRELEPERTYGLSVSGSSPRGIKVMMNRAAKALDLELRWAPYQPKAPELYVELKG